MQTGTAYAIWGALGTILIMLISVVFLGEPITLIKIVGVALVVGGVLTINLGSSH